MYKVLRDGRKNAFGLKKEGKLQKKKKLETDHIIIFSNDVVARPRINCTEIIKKIFYSQRNDFLKILCNCIDCNKRIYTCKSIGNTVKNNILYMILF